MEYKISNTKPYQSLIQVSSSILDDYNGMVEEEIRRAAYQKGGKEKKTEHEQIEKDLQDYKENIRAFLTEMQKVEKMKAK